MGTTQPTRFAPCLPSFVGSADHADAQMLRRTSMAAGTLDGFDNIVNGNFEFSIRYLKAIFLNISPQ